MTYRINKTDGTILSEVRNGLIDQISTSLTLIGSNFAGYGEFLNENFVKLLENFSSTDEPTHPITGQLWFDVSQSVLKVYDGTRFKNASGPMVKSTKPISVVAGDIWFDSTNNVMWFYDGADWVMVGPDHDYIRSRPISLCLETGTRAESDAATYTLLVLNQVAPVDEYANNTMARIFCTGQVSKLRVYKLESGSWTVQQQ